MVCTSRASVDEESHLQHPDGPEININDNAEPARKSFFSTILHYLLIPFKRFFNFIRKHPIILITAVFTSFPNFINSLLVVLKVKAKNLSWALLLAAPLQKKFAATVLSLSAFSVNVLLGAVFLPKAIKVLFNKETWVKHPYRSTIALFLGIAGALSLGVIALEAFSFSTWLAIPMAIAAVLVNFATRFVNASEGLRRIAEKWWPDNDLSEDEKLQQKYIEKLKHLKKNYLKEVNETLARAAHKLDKKDADKFYNELLLCLDKKLNEISQLDPELTEIDHTSQIKARAGLIFDIVFAALMALSGYLIFAQKGFDGFAILGKWINGSLDTTLEDMNKLFQLLLSGPSGIASAILYGLTAFDLRQILTSTAYYLYQHPQDIPYGLVVLCVCLLSGSPMYSVAANIALNPKGIFSSTLRLFPQLFAVSGAMDSIIVNTKASLNKAYLHDPNIESPTVEDIIRYFDNTKEHPIATDVFTTLKQQTFFSKVAPPNTSHEPPPQLQSCENSLRVLSC